MKRELKTDNDFPEVERKPAYLLGTSYLYFLAGAAVLGLLYVWNLSVIGRNAVVPVVLTDSVAFVQDIPMRSPKLIPPVDVMKAGVPSEALLSKGAELFRANCSSCHGEDGMGDGPAGVNLNPKPRNFKSLQGWTNGSKVSQIYRTLQNGVAGTAMASYNYLLPEDRFALAHYVRTFAPGQPSDTQEDLEKLETDYQLSKGSSVPGQIPVSRATAIIIHEQSPTVTTVAALVQRLHADTLDTGALLLRQYAADPARVFASFVARDASLPELARFLEMTAADPLRAGFKPAIVNISEPDWLAIYRYLSVLRNEREETS